ncbi:hypothetical protein BS47DRAFT_1346313, partial [Hydnum rufescens UP504]
MADAAASLHRRSAIESSIPALSYAVVAPSRMPRLDSNSLLGQCGPAITNTNGPKAHLTYRNARGRPHPELARNVLMPSNSMTFVLSELGEIWRRFGFFSLYSLNPALKISLVLGNTY